MTICVDSVISSTASEKEISMENLSLTNIPSAYSGVKNIKEFSQWIMRNWFNQEKHSAKPWFDSTVTENTVLANIISNSKFPYSTNQIIDIWNAIPIIRQGLRAKAPSAEESHIELPAEKPTEEYKTGETTLAKISNEVGGFSVTAIMNLSDAASEKMKRFFAENDAINETQSFTDSGLLAIDIARKAAAGEYVKLLKSCLGDTQLFFAALVKQRIIKDYEVNLISLNEIQGLMMLMEMDDDIAEFVLLEDLESSMAEENIFKTFQNAASVRIFPAKKRGRPHLVKTK